MKNSLQYKISYNDKKDNILKDWMNDYKPFDMIISCRKAEPYDTPAIISAPLQKLCDYPTLLKKLTETKPAPELVHICGFESVKEISEVLSIIKDNVKSLHIFKCPMLESLSFVENLPRLKTLSIYWNKKTVKLFDASRMVNLRKLHITDCNKLVDFSGLENSNLEYLDLYGCNGLSSFTSKLDVGDLKFLQNMPKLKHLGLEIMKKQEDKVYLKAIAKVKTLESINIGSSFFTFEQFAWLSAQLPNIKEGLEPCTYYISPTNKGNKIIPEVDEYFVIGRHKTKVKRAKAKKYLDAYNSLREEYKTTPEPPLPSFAIKI